jgi:hypothetical protein
VDYFITTIEIHQLKFIFAENNKIHPHFLLNLSNIDTIIANYNKMSDQQLLLIAEEDLIHLTPEALSAFWQEVKKRKILIPEKINPQIEPAYSSINIHKIERHLLQYILEKKEQHHSDAYITGGLLERGLDEDSANEIIKQIPEYISNRKNKMNQLILTGTLQLVSGIAINVLPLSREKYLAVIIISYCLIIFGTGRILHGYLNKRRFAKMIQANN